MDVYVRLDKTDWPIIFSFLIKGKIKESGSEHGAIVQITSHSAEESVIILLFSDIRQLYVMYSV